VSHDAIDVETHVVLLVGVCGTARILHDGAQVRPADEPIIASSATPVNPHGELLGYVQKIGSLDDGNAGF
jgi:hypothetical protein